MACHGGPDIVEDNLVLCLDAANTKSYSGTGTTWNDLSGNANNGTIDGATFNTDVFDFDGTNDCIELPNDDLEPISNTDLFNGSNNFTVEFWFNADDLPANGSSSPYSQVLLGGGTRRFFILFGDNLDDKEVGVRTNMGSWISPVGSGTDSIANSTWYNVIVTYDSSSGFVLYLNGYQKDTSSTTGTITTQTFDSNSRLIGTLYDPDTGTAPNRFFDGKISICRIYNKVITSAEVKQNFDALKGRYGL